MTKLQDLLFNVRKVDNSENTNSEHAYKVIGNIDGVDKVLNYCSDRYELVDNKEIFPAIETELKNRNMEFSAHYEQVNNARFYSKIILEDQSLAIGSGNDVVKPMVSINHSYNGLTKYSITFGYFRLVCSNGLVIPLEGHEDKNLNISGKHTKEILNSIDLLFDKMNVFFDLQPTIKKRFEVLTDRAIPNYGERIEAVLNATKLKPSKSQLTEINVTAINEANTLNGGVVNDWLIYNAINAYIYKAKDNKGNRSKAAPETKMSIDKKVLEYIMK